MKKRSGRGRESQRERERERERKRKEGTRRYAPPVIRPCLKRVADHFREVSL